MALCPKIFTNFPKIPVIYPERSRRNLRLILCLRGRVTSRNTIYAIRNTSNLTSKFACQSLRKSVHFLKFPAISCQKMQKSAIFCNLRFMYLIACSIRGYKGFHQKSRKTNCPKTTRIEQRISTIDNCQL